MLGTQTNITVTPIEDNVTLVIDDSNDEVVITIQDWNSNDNIIDDQAGIGDLHKTWSANKLAENALAGVAVSVDAGNTIEVRPDGLYSKSIDIEQGGGQSTDKVISQKGVSDIVDDIYSAIAGSGVAVEVVQELGDSITKVISQKGVTDAIDAVEVDVQAVSERVDDNTNEINMLTLSVGNVSDQVQLVDNHVQSVDDQLQITNSSVDTLQGITSDLQDDVTSLQSVTTSLQSNVSSLQDSKVDKELGKSLISDSEILRLSTVDNFNPTPINTRLDSVESTINTLDGSITTLSETKVDKVVGKQLSDENYTLAEKNKLAGLEGSKWKGLYTSFAELPSVGESGDYADVDSGVGEDVKRYIWDNSDNKWVGQGGNDSSLTGAEIKQLYEAQPDTNAYTDSDKSKLSGIQSGATANSTDSQLRDRSTHTGTQLSSTISDFNTAVSANVDVSANTLARHSHSNKAILDATTAPYTTDDNDKLSGIADNATKNRSDTDTDLLLSGKVSNDDIRLNNAREWLEDTVTQEEAEEGTSSSRRAWTAQRVRQAINAWWQLVTSGFGRNFIAASNEQAARNVLQLGSVATRNVGTDAGDVMAAGAGGLLAGVGLPSNMLVNANEVLNTGWNPVGDTWAGSPFSGVNGDNQGYLFTQIWTASAKFRLQTFYNINGNLISAWRRYDDGVWTPWYFNAHSANLLTTTGQSTLFPMSQKATTDAIANIPSVPKSVGYTVTAANKGASIDTSANVTIPASVFTVGDVLVITNTSASSISIVPDVGVTLRLAGTASTGTRTLAGYGVATFRMASNNVWFASGAGLS